LLGGAERASQAGEGAGTDQESPVLSWTCGGLWCVRLIAGSVSGFWSNAMYKLFALLIAGFMTVSLAGCNTLEGAGDDVEEAGDTVEEATD
jgi:predicted small secreted protein